MGLKQPELMFVRKPPQSLSFELKDNHIADFKNFLDKSQKTLTQKLKSLEDECVSELGFINSSARHCPKDRAGQFNVHTWQRPQGGGGHMAIMRGHHVEKTGVNVSLVHGQEYPATESHFANQPFLATGLSTITHMYNPFAPIAHLNVRLIKVGRGFWFGGGGDLTPLVAFKQDTQDFHNAMYAACKSHPKVSVGVSPEAIYQELSEWCDEYFYIKHRKSIRGVGGLFFDYMQGEYEQLAPFVKAVASAYITTYPKILKRRMKCPFDDDKKQEQLFWRGRYAEFNLVYDRGTKFGLMTGGNVDAIFVSMPPVVKW